MSDGYNLTSQMRAITISREYGSGGGEIASRLASHLGWELVDHEIVARIAQDLEISEEEVEIHDERGESTVSHILISMRAIHPALFTVSPSMAILTDPALYHQALSRVVEGAIAGGQVVIVGRGSQVILGDRRDVMHVRIVARLAHRIAYVMKREGLDRVSAQNRIQVKDQDRTRYLQTYYHRRPDDTALYDLSVNTSIIGLDNVVELILQALERKAAQLKTPTQKLGPATGLMPYPGRPEDIRPPIS
jgi:cytidylate kinase